MRYQIHPKVLLLLLLQLPLLLSPQLSTAQAIPDQSVIAVLWFSTFSASRGSLFIKNFLLQLLVDINFCFIFDRPFNH